MMKLKNLIIDFIERRTGLVNVIRCKDCALWNGAVNKFAWTGCRRTGLFAAADDYCSDAEIIY